jgi:hypothetical protein
MRRVDIHSERMNDRVRVRCDARVAIRAGARASIHSERFIARIHPRAIVRLLPACGLIVRPADARGHPFHSFEEVNPGTPTALRSADASLNSKPRQKEPPMNTSLNTNKKMYKVISPIEKRGGGTYWLRVGSAFTNKDDSINLYLDAMPAPNGKSFQLQIRELTEEDLRRRETNRDGGSSSGGSSGSGSGGGYGSGSGGGYGGGGSDVGGTDGLAASGYGRDRGGIGGGPSSRAVTANVSRGGDDIPF